APRRQRPATLLQTPPQLGRDVERQLLLEDDVQKRTKARGPARKAGQADGREDAREVRIEPRERPGPGLEPIGRLSRGPWRSCAAGFYGLIHSQTGASIAMLRRTRAGMSGEACGHSAVGAAAGCG